ncbi:MAG: DUF2298 domain-containing protein, partial [Chloroflexota bacterium]|nr:DUF2298 domain-containing protein [Chloroflexota bacterium]
RWQRLALGEGLFLALFGLFFFVRTTNPDLWHPLMGGEKPMDFAFLNATMKSSYFPPYDPWFAGGYINYYYFGFVIVGTLIKLLGIVPAVAYNLAIPLLPALTGIGAFSIVASLAGWSGSGKARAPIAAGLLAVLFVGVIGNLGEIALIFQGLLSLAGPGLHFTIPGVGGLAGAIGGVGQLLAGRALPFRIEWWYWNATRLIPNVINEFPFFTFLYGDLHAHAIALPFTLLSVGTGVSLLLASARREPGVPSPAIRVAAPALLGLTIGALRATNTWDYPTYLALSAAILILADTLRRGRFGWAAVWRAAFQTVVVLALAALLFWPYSRHFVTLYDSLQPWAGERTQIGPYLLIHGIALFPLTIFLLKQIFGSGSRSVVGRLIRALFINRRRPGAVVRRLARCAVAPMSQHVLMYLAEGMLLFALVLAALAVLQLWVPLLLVALLGLAAALLFSARLHPRKRVICLLAGLGLSLNLATEFLVITGDVGRMNTVFKLDFQAWVLFGLAAVLALHDLHQELRPSFTRGLVLGGSGVLVACGLVYTLGSSVARAHDRFEPLPLTDDGQAYMTEA